MGYLRRRDPWINSGKFLCPKCSWKHEWTSRLVGVMWIGAEGVSGYPHRWMLKGQFPGYFPRPHKETENYEWDWVQVFTTSMGKVVKTLIKINLSFIKYKIVYFSLNRLCSLNFLPVNRVKNKHSNVRLMIQVVGSRRENRKEKKFPTCIRWQVSEPSCPGVLGPANT